MELRKMENLVCDVLWDAKNDSVYKDRSKSIYYIDTFERLNKEGYGVVVYLYDGTQINLIISIGHKNVDI